MSDLDAKSCVANLDARGFCRGYTDPLAMMGCEKPSKSFPTMPVNEIYVISIFIGIFIKVFFEFSFYERRIFFIQSLEYEVQYNFQYNE